MNDRKSIRQRGEQLLAAHGTNLKNISWQRSIPARDPALASSSSFVAAVAHIILTSVGLSERGTNDVVGSLA